MLYGLGFYIFRGTFGMLSSYFFYRLTPYRNCNGKFFERMREERYTERGKQQHKITCQEVREEKGVLKWQKNCGFARWSELAFSETSGS